MIRYIEEDSVRDKILYGKAYISAELEVYIKKVFDETPVADVAPVRHGKWIETGYYSRSKNPIYLCSVCHKEVEDRFIKNHKFCLHCGAKMDLED